MGTDAISVTKSVLIIRSCLSFLRLIIFSPFVYCWRIQCSGLLFTSGHSISFAPHTSTGRILTLEKFEKSSPQHSKYTTISHVVGRPGNSFPPPAWTKRTHLLRDGF